MTTATGTLSTTLASATLVAFASVPSVSASASFTLVDAVLLGKVYISVGRYNSPAILLN